MGPKGVAVDRNGHIIVVDNKSCCVFTFQPNGKLVGRFGGRGATDRHFAGIGGGFRYLVPETPAPENSPICCSSKDPFSYILALGDPIPALYPSTIIPETPPTLFLKDKDYPDFQQKIMGLFFQIESYSMYSFIYGFFCSMCSVFSIIAVSFSFLYMPLYKEIAHLSTSLLSGIWVVSKFGIL